MHKVQFEKIYICKKIYIFASKYIYLQAKIDICKQRYTFASKDIYLQAKIYICKKMYTFASKYMQLHIREDVRTFQILAIHLRTREKSKNVRNIKRMENE